MWSKTDPVQVATGLWVPVQIRANAAEKVNVWKFLPTIDVFL